MINELHPIILLAYHTLAILPQNALLTSQNLMCKTTYKKITCHWQQAGILLKLKTTQNKWSHSQASACLTQSFHAVFFNISHEPNPSPAWCYYLEITQSICLWFQRIFALNTWFFLCLHLIHHEPCHLSFSVTQIHIIHIYSWVISFSNLYGTLGRGGTSLTNKRQQNTKYWPFQLK